MKKFSFVCTKCGKDIGDEMLQDDVKDPQKRCELCWIWSKPINV